MVDLMLIICAVQPKVFSPFELLVLVPYLMDCLATRFARAGQRQTVLSAS